MRKSLLLSTLVVFVSLASAPALSFAKTLDELIIESGFSSEDELVSIIDTDTATRHVDPSPTLKNDFKYSSEIGLQNFRSSGLQFLFINRFRDSSSDGREASASNHDSYADKSFDDFKFEGRSANSVQPLFLISGNIVSFSPSRVQSGWPNFNGGRVEKRLKKLFDLLDAPAIFRTIKSFIWWESLRAQEEYNTLNADLFGDEDRRTLHVSNYF